MAKRKPLPGRRRHIVTASQHNGTQDDHGQLTYATAADWEDVVSNWPCELVVEDVISKDNGSVFTTNIFYGDYHHATGIVTGMRLTTEDGVVFDVIASFDEAGTRREMRVNAKRQVSP